jgi:glutamate--cysteine ligase
MESIETAARALDAVSGGGAYAQAVAAQRVKLADPAATPAARVLETMRERGQSFVAFALAQSEAHAAHFRARPPTADALEVARALAERSLREQAELERRDAPESFDDFVNDYRGYTLDRFSV